jgi:hypothetical protein
MTNVAELTTDLILEHTKSDLSLRIIPRTFVSKIAEAGQFLEKGVTDLMKYLSLYSSAANLSEFL